jgi:hypothetical protein
MDFNIMEILLTIITGLLGVVGYFLRQIHTEFKGLKESMNSLNTRIAVRDERDKFVDKKLTELEKRVSTLEKK